MEKILSNAVNENFLFLVESNPKPNKSIVMNTQFDEGMYFTYVEDVTDSVKKIKKELIESLTDEYGDIGIYYYPNHLQDEFEKRWGMASQAIQSQQAINENFELVPLPEDNWPDIIFYPRNDEEMCFGLLRKKIPQGNFLVVLNYSNGDTDLGLFAKGLKISEYFSDIEFYATGGEENGGANTTVWLEEYEPELKKQLKS